MDILVADDNPSTRILLRNQLRSWGYRVRTATNGLEAWSLLNRSDHPEMAILDWNMPSMEGIDVYDALRSARPYKDGWSHARTVETIREGKGTHIDPALVAAFESCSAAFAEIFATEGEEAEASPPVLEGEGQTCAS